MSEDKLQQMYDWYQILSDAKDKVGEHSDIFRKCINGAKGSEKEKSLATQIISKYFKHFPALHEEALSAIWDLCEYEENKIRIHAIQALPIICKESKKYVFKVADCLSQLMQLEEQEYLAACKALDSVFKIDPINTTKAVFLQTRSDNVDDIGKERCILNFFRKLVKSLDKLPSDLEDLIIEECKKLLPISSAPEFIEIIQFLSSSKLAKTISGQKEIVDMVADRVDLNQPLEALEEDNSIDRIIMCVQYVLPIFNANVPSTKFLIYYTDQILPQWKKIADFQKGEMYQLQLLRQLAELSHHCGKLDNASLHVVQIFDKLKDYMPPPPENAEVIDLPNLDFTAVECLLYAFHKLARQCPDFLTHDPLVLKDFRARLTYFSRGVQGCKKSIDTTINSKINVKKEDTAKIKIAPVVLNNINALIRDLFYSPPVYKCNVQLSFKTDVVKKIQVGGDTTTDKQSQAQKRHTPIKFDSSNGSSAPKQSRNNRGGGDNMKLYTPPSGKFSNNFQNYDRGGNRNRNRGGGGHRNTRGRGGGRNWRN